VREDRVSVSCADGHSPDVEDLCQAMLIEGARVLGFAFGANISLEAQEKIAQAAYSLGERLAILLQIGNEVNCEAELAN